MIRHAEDDKTYQYEAISLVEEKHKKRIKAIDKKIKSLAKKGKTNYESSTAVDKETADAIAGVFRSRSFHCSVYPKGGWSGSDSEKREKRRIWIINIEWDRNSRDNW